jgi:hypothetical protein
MTPSWPMPVSEFSGMRNSGDGVPVENNDVHFKIDHDP